MKNMDYGKLAHVFKKVGKGMSYPLLGLLPGEIQERLAGKENMKPSMASLPLEFLLGVTVFPPMAMASVLRAGIIGINEENKNYPSLETESHPVGSLPVEIPYDIMRIAYHHLRSEYDNYRSR